MRILYFCQHFSTPKGATGLRPYSMARRLIRHGHAVTVVCGSYGGGDTGLETPFLGGRREGTVDGIRIIEFNLAYSNADSFLKRSRTFLRFAIRSVGLALRESYDIAFATTTPLTAGIPGVVARWIRWKPFVFEVRDLWPELPREMGVITNPVVLFLMSALEWTSYHSACRLIGLSPGIVDGIARRGIAHERIRLIPNGCDLDIFTPEVAPVTPDGVDPKAFLAIYAGTHGFANGLDAVLNAAAELNKRNEKRIALLLIGNGRLKNELQARALREGLDNVIFHPSVDKIRLAGLFARADLGMQLLANVPAFYYGTSPNKFFDYISAGLPVLNNYPGWVAEMIQKHECGFVIPPEDPVAFAEALIQAAETPERLRKQGGNARALAEDRFDRSRLADQWVDWVTGAAV